MYVFLILHVQSQNTASRDFTLPDPYETFKRQIHKRFAKPSDTQLEQWHDIEQWSNTNLIKGSPSHEKIWTEILEVAPKVMTGNFAIEPARHVLRRNRKGVYTWGCLVVLRIMHKGSLTWLKSPSGRRWTERFPSMTEDKWLNSFPPSQFTAVLQGKTAGKSKSGRRGPSAAYVSDEDDEESHEDDEDSDFEAWLQTPQAVRTQTSLRTASAQESVSSCNKSTNFTLTTIPNADIAQRPPQAKSIRGCLRRYARSPNLYPTQSLRNTLALSR